MGKKFDEMLRLMDSGTRNIVQSANDEYCKKNAEFRAKAGLEVLIIRESLGECCSWCSDLEGVYTYDTAPDDVYARHRDCNCVVSTRTKKGTFQDAWSKKEYANYREHRIEKAQEMLRERRDLDEETLNRIRGIVSEKETKIASTIEDAKKELKKMGLEASGYYDKMNLEIANAVNAEIQNAFSIFGNLHEKGTLDGVRVLKNKNADYYAAYRHSMKEVNLLQHNVQYKKSLAKMKEDSVFEYTKGIWSTPSEMHSVRHELGHAVQYTLGPDKITEIEALRVDTLNKLGIKRIDLDNVSIADALVTGEKLSYYGFATYGEMIAESVAEYMNGHPRELAKRVVDIILR